MEHNIDTLLKFWVFDPWIIAGLFVAACLYSLGWRSLARRSTSTGPVLKERAWLFAGGMASLVLALVSPLDGLAGEVFSAHMLQHTLLMLVAAPLLVLSYPLPPILLGLPAGLRRAIGHSWRRASWLRGLWHFLSQPLTAWILEAGLLWLWHAPVLYQAAVENDWVHALEHLCFLGSAMLFWWVTVHTFSRRPAQRGIGILYLFTAALPGSLLGALFVFSPSVWYPVYAARAPGWGLSALADQQLAGTIMWVPAGMIYLIAALLIMKSWLDTMEGERTPVNVRKSE